MEHILAPELELLLNFIIFPGGKYSSPGTGTTFKPHQQRAYDWPSCVENIIMVQQYGTINYISTNSNTNRSTIET